jgi:hypothetical protein
MIALLSSKFKPFSFSCSIFVLHFRVQVAGNRGTTKMIGDGASPPAFTPSQRRPASKRLDSQAFTSAYEHSGIIPSCRSPLQGHPCARSCQSASLKLSKPRRPANVSSFDAEKRHQSASSTSCKRPAWGHLETSKTPPVIISKHTPALSQLPFIAVLCHRPRTPLQCMLPQQTPT